MCSKNGRIRSRFSHISFFPHVSPCVESLQERISGSMPPKADKPKKSSDSGRDSRNEQNEIPEEKFKAMLLKALRTDEEVRTSVAHILRSRETDVFSAVVECLEKDNIKHRIGELME